MLVQPESKFIVVQISITFKSPLLAGRPHTPPGTHRVLHKLSRPPLSLLPHPPQEPSAACFCPQSHPEGPGSCPTLLIPVREQVELLLFEEGSLELCCSRGLDTPTLPGDVRGGWRRASGGQAEAVAVQGRNNTGRHQGPSPDSTWEALVRPHRSGPSRPMGRQQLRSPWEPTELHPQPSLPL